MSAGQHREPPVIAGRVPPHALAAEAAVLSAMLVSSDAFDEVGDLLRAEHFYSEANRHIYESAIAVRERGYPVDVVTVAEALRDAELIQAAGGAKYIGQIVDATPAVADVRAHADIVVNKWRLRRLIATCQRYAAEGYGDVGDPQDFIDAAQQAVYELSATDGESTVEPIKDLLVSAFAKMADAAERGDRIIGTPTGFTDLDTKIAGLQRGDLLIIAGRPSMGKSALAINMAVHIAAPQQLEDSTETRPGEPVVIFSLETPKDQVAIRMVCGESRTDLGRLRRGRLEDVDWQRLTASSSFLSELPIWVDDTAALGLIELRAKVRRLQTQLAREHPEDDPRHRLGAVIVDYLQLMGGRRERGVQREEFVSDLSRGLKWLAKDLDVPVIALAQLNRSCETRGKDKRPILSDLRESGAIEQDADTIIFIYRDEYYNKETTDRKDIAELIIAKQRNGPTGVVLLRWWSSCTRFDNLAHDEYDYGDTD